MSASYGWDPMDGPSRAFSESKSCLSCKARFWPPKKIPYAAFCDTCWASIAKGICPVAGHHPAALEPAGVWADWPVVVCGRNRRPFAEVHPFAVEAKPGYCLLCGARSTVLDSSQRCPSCSEAGVKP